MGELDTLSRLDDLADRITRERQLYVRWSRGPAVDLARSSSSDELTGVPLPGLSANSLDVEPWWEDRPVRTWAARRLYDYSHLPASRRGTVRPWLLTGRECGRGPDNEPLVCDVTPLAWIDRSVIDEAVCEVERQGGPWGPVRRVS
ncbi:hypothetical protein GCM10010358_49470 [Streptomyces minutiscleroticus]|uniref:Uncharacterized protein n=1 Tax=Streptomyces minutiscleroticus TaxID=68238 RepID=A0A918NR97_9ACTN|nr:DUF6098 family protein [Streptomyces minutiscleroticus]GGX89626.1 hypothetical protein GCM10010358_49470 [Streptomyces minutiscleroticus]